MLGIIMLGMGMTLRFQDFKYILIAPKAVLTGVLAQYTVMPLLAWLLCLILNFPDELTIGFILLGCCPGGTASNVITFLARGDVALSVAMTSVSTLLSPLLTPLLTYLIVHERIAIDISGMFFSISKIVLLPVLAGLLINHFASSKLKKAKIFLPLISITAILFIVGGIIGKNVENGLPVSLPMVCMLLFAIILHNGLGLLFGYLIGKKMNLSLPQTRALSIEVGMQNSGLAVGLAKAHFTALSGIPGALFSIWHNISGPILASIWKRASK